MRTAVFLCILLLAVFAARAQHTVFKNYSVTAGLPSSEVYKVFQDSKGYIWFCTDAGVCRYDGYAFRSFTSEHGLPDNTIFDLYEDKKGRIWFWGMAKKLSYYNPVSDSIYVLACNDSLSWHIGNSSITSLYTQADTLYLGVNSGASFFKILPAGNYEKVLSINFNKPGWQICCFKDNNFIWGTTSPDQKKYVTQFSIYEQCAYPLYYKQFDPTPTDCVERYRHIAKTKDGFLMSENDRLFNVKKDSFFTVPLQGQAIISLYVDKAGDIWCGTKGNGILRYKHGNLHSKPACYLYKTSVTSIVQDREGGYWFSTLEHGVYYAPSFVFSYYDQSAGLSGTKVYSVLSRGPNTFCFTEEGRLNVIDDTVIIKKDVIGRQLYSIARDSNVLLIAGDNSRFYNFSTGRSCILKGIPVNHPYFLRKVSASGDNIFGLFSSGICRIDVFTGVVSQMIKGYHRLTAIYAMPDTVWFGSSTGLHCLVKGHVIYPGDEEPLLKNRVDDICMDSRDNMWIATKGAGVLVKHGTHISQLSVQNGLPSNLCKTLMPDSGNVMWVGTNRGISRITWLHDTTYAIDNYSSTDGLLSDEINEFSMNGNFIYAATNQGLVKFDKTALQLDKVAPPAYITEFYVNDLKQNIAPAYTLEHNENFIRIGFLGLSYKTPGHLLYKYKLSGLDTSWKYTQNTNVQFTTLPPGDYTFVVYAISHDKVQSESPAMIMFHINKPFWKTWWFILGSAILLLICIYFIFSTRIRRIKKAEAEKTAMNKKLSEVELKAIRAQMNPHFIFNSINSIQLYILMNDADTAYRYLSKFSKLIRNVLENSKHELISLHEEVETVELYIELEKLRFETRFEHHIYIDPLVDSMVYAIPPLLIQPYVENAIWHGLMPQQKKGVLNISFTDAGELIRCGISDNGIGRKRSGDLKANNRAHHRSLALSLNQERLEMIGYLYHNKLQINIIDLHDEDGQPAGTSVELYIPKINFNGYDNSDHR